MRFGVANVCELVGGLTFFLYGMQLATEGLRSAAGHRLRSVLAMVTGNRLYAATAGVLVTVSIQSSSATTVILVGLADAGMMTLTQTIGVILGAAIGTTLTVQMIAFDLGNYTLLLLAVGFLVQLLAKTQSWRSFGQLLIGFGLVFYGMHLMKMGMKPLRHYPAVVDMLRNFGRRPWLGVLVAMAITAIIQSSGATLAIAVALASQNANPDPSGAFQPMLSLEAAVPIVFGANIGTCATAILASLAATRKGKQVAAAHLLIKIFSVLIFLPFIVPLAEIVQPVTLAMFRSLGQSTALSGPLAARQVANVHTLFNLGVLVIFIPFVRPMARLIERLLPAPKGRAVAAIRGLDLRRLNEPEIALELAAAETRRAATMVQSMLGDLRRGIDEMTMAPVRAVARADDRVDLLSSGVIEYLTRLSLPGRKLSRDQSRRKDTLLYIVRNIEYIGDTLSRDLGALAEKFISSGAALSIEGARQLREFADRIVANCAAVVQAIEAEGPAPGQSVVAYEAEIEDHRRRLHDAHMERLRRGVREAIETSDVFMDMVTQFRQINYFLADIVRTLEHEQSPGGEP